MGNGHDSSFELLEISDTYLDEMSLYEGYIIELPLQPGYGVGI